MNDDKQITDQINELTSDQKNNILQKLEEGLNKRAPIELYKKLHSIMTEVGTIQKDKKNEFHKYMYASEYAIKKAINPLLIKYSVLFILEVTNQERVGNNTLIRNRYRFIDIDTGQELVGEFAGEGTDTGDKATYKAITGAIKYILTSTFLIPTGDDPEGDLKTDSPKKGATADERKKLIEWMERIQKMKTKEDGSTLQNDLKAAALTVREKYVVKMELTDRAKQLNLI